MRRMRDARRCQRAQIRHVGLTFAMRLFGESLVLAKTFHGGTHRMRSPEETVAHFRPLMPRLGITRLANLTGLDNIGLPTWMAVRPNSRGLSTSQGKGWTHAAAQASALMESIENWHGEMIVQPVRIASSYDMRRTEPVCDVLQLSRYADRPLRPDLPIGWIEGRNLSDDTARWVPWETVSTDYTASPEDRAETIFVQSSNGLAGGNHLAEAVSHALTELVERDAVTKTADQFRKADPARRIKRESIENPELRDLLSLLDEAALDTVLFDLTVDTDIPVCGCTIVDREAALRWRLLPHFSGYGCHLSPDVALSRAITEAVQSRVTYISGSRDDISAQEYRRGGHVDDLENYRRLARGGEDEVDFTNLPDRSTTCFAQDIETVLQALAAVGVDEVIAVDLRREELGVPVVKLVAPRLAAPVSMIRGRPIVVPERGWAGTA
jgi:YcaO-like protein with predicted kinase domain